MNQFVSYAQNFEDVMLWRALKHIERGFFVDVGANDPKFDSVTYAFYEKGWRGINIEPMAAYYEALCEQRPRDINLNVAVGASEGELTLYEVPATGISSILPDAVYQNKFLEGRPVFERKVPAKTLDSIFDEYVRGDIHFLKIDVEGYEKPVLEGLNLKKWRPWILLVEATLPNTPNMNEDFPEEAIVSSGYTFVYFDGLNRFYIANEHSELRDSFSAPPNVFDYYVLIGQVKANQEIESLRSKAEQAQSDLKHLRDVIYPELEWARTDLVNARNELEWARTDLTNTRKELEWIRTDLNYVRNELSGAREVRDALFAKNAVIEKQLSAHQAVVSELNRVRTELDAKRAEAEMLRIQYINVLYSLSYRITAPLRSFYRLVAKIRMRLRPGGSREAGVQQAAPIPASDHRSISADQMADEQYYVSFFQREIKHRKILLKDQAS